MTKVRATANDDDGLHFNDPIEVGFIARYDVTGPQTDTSFQLSPPSDHDAAQIWSGVGLGGYIDGLPTEGTITGLTVINGGTGEVEEIWSDFAIPALNFRNWVIHNKDAQAQAAFFGGSDQFIGGANADSILGFGGNDDIRGGGGSDTINGGLGHDTLSGGGGRDTFVFNAPVSATHSDIITDFTRGDKVAFENSVFALGAEGALGPAKFFAGANAHDANDRVLYDAATGHLFYDANGNAAGQKVLIATLDEGLTLTASDFRVI